MSFIKMRIWTVNIAHHYTHLPYPPCANAYAWESVKILRWSVYCNFQMSMATRWIEPCPSHWKMLQLKFGQNVKIHSCLHQHSIFLNAWWLNLRICFHFGCRGQTIFLGFHSSKKRTKYLHNFALAKYQGRSFSFVF